MVGTTDTPKTVEHDPHSKPLDALLIALDTTQVTHEPTIPIALCVLEHRGQHVLWKVLRCPICGKEHRHGAGDGSDPRRYLSHRSAHCTLGDLRRLGVASKAHGYILQEAS